MLIPFLLAATAWHGTLPVRHVAAARTFDLVIAATTDSHGRVRGWNYETNRPDSARGLSRAATIVDSLRHDAP